MTVDTALVHETTLLKATDQRTLPSALSWVAEGHPLIRQTDLHAVARAVLHFSEGRRADDALKRITRELAGSGLDPAAELHRADLLPDAAVFRKALQTLADVSGGTIARVTASTLRVAQNRDSHVMEALEAMIGLTHKELAERVEGLPTDASKAWTNTALNRAFEYINDLVSGQLPEPTLAGSFVPLPVELMPAITGPLGTSGWERLEQLRTGGVPYELMLAQRFVGSAWGQHRNRTSQAPMAAAAVDLRNRLAAAGFDVVLSDKYGGDVKPAVLNELVGGDAHVNLIARTGPPEHRPVMAVTFSLAKDGGSARKTLSAKLQMRKPNVPVSVVVLGGGFAARNETIELLRHFGGAVYTERTLDALVDAAQTMATQK